jgi:hypothetical protein
LDTDGEAVLRRARWTGDVRDTEPATRGRLWIREVRALLAKDIRVRVESAHALAVVVFNGDVARGSGFTGPAAALHLAASAVLLQALSRIERLIAVQEAAAVGSRSK